VWEDEEGGGVRVMRWTTGGVGKMKGRKEVERAAMVVESNNESVPTYVPLMVIA